LSATVDRSRPRPLILHTRRVQLLASNEYLHVCKSLLNHADACRAAELQLISVFARPAAAVVAVGISFFAPSTCHNWRVTRRTVHQRRVIHAYTGPACVQSWFCHEKNYHSAASVTDYGCDISLFFRL